MCLSYTCPIKIFYTELTLPSLSALEIFTRKISKTSSTFSLRMLISALPSLKSDLNDVLFIYPYSSAHTK